MTVAAKRKPANAAPSDAGAVTSLSALAKALSVSRRTVDRWRKADGFPGRDRYYPLEEIAEWARQMRSDSRDRTGTRVPHMGTKQLRMAEIQKLDKELRAEQLKMRQLRNKKSELELAERRGELIPASEIEAQWAARCSEMRRGLQVLGRRVAPRDQGLRDRIEAEVLLLLEAYSRPLET